MKKLLVTLALTATAATPALADADFCNQVGRIGMVAQENRHNGMSLRETLGVAEKSFSSAILPIAEATIKSVYQHIDFDAEPVAAGRVTAMACMDAFRRKQNRY